MEWTMEWTVEWTDGMEYQLTKMYVYQYNCKFTFDLT